MTRYYRDHRDHQQTSLSDSSRESFGEKEANFDETISENDEGLTSGDYESIDDGGSTWVGRDNTSDEQFSDDEILGREEIFINNSSSSNIEHWIPEINYTNVSEKFATRPFALRATIIDGIAKLRLDDVSKLRQLFNAMESKKRNTISVLDEEANSSKKIECFMIRQKHSFSRLQISLEIFNLLKYHRQIFYGFKDHVMSFGWKIQENDIGPPRYRSKRTEPSHDYQGRFECVYGLRYVEFIGDSFFDWRLRQTAVYQSWKRNPDYETWVFISPSNSMEQKVKSHLKRAKTSDENQSFSLHLDLVRLSLKNWRWYIKNLVEQVTNQSSRITATSADKDDSRSIIDFQITFKDRQKLRILEDKVLDLMIVWNSTIDTITSLSDSWKKMKNSSADSISCDPISDGLHDCQQEVRLYQQKTESLLMKVQGTSSLLDSLLEYENGTSLKILAGESRSENILMRQLAEKGAKDAKAVKAISLITVLYLPMTVVAGFFSTQFVSQEITPSGRLSLILTENAWIYVAASAPLTVVTIAVWYAWIHYPWKTWSVLQWTPKFSLGGNEEVPQKKYHQRISSISSSEHSGV
ncbi:hypothetical protein BS50DRAFT_633450 [Corynespora cassiicola Philippines]|uniref:CorA-like transporter domain-containing protein n=1 Tax=Corynespora cassiicola Philippines TaxID=1448308 RepID=A0A2T2NQU3_CORCC|nr:hypothetical protein BS50DRAFT_633450 [Corynespora cassiicola Philippines]